MPRKRRIILPEVTYHTTSRCIEKKPLMGSTAMKDLMISVLQMTAQKYTYNLITYSIMDNHFHFYIQTCKEGESISRIMQFIKSQFARRYNRLMSRTGPFWNERFSDTIIELHRSPETAFFSVLFYIFFNPVRSRYVADPRDYPYTSIRCYLDETYVSPVPITLHDYFMKLGDTFEERVRKLLEYEELYRKRIFPESMFA